MVELEQQVLSGESGRKLYTGLVDDVVVGSQHASHAVCWCLMSTHCFGRRMLVFCYLFIAGVQTMDDGATHTTQFIVVITTICIEHIS